MKTAIEDLDANNLEKIVAYLPPQNQKSFSLVGHRFYQATPYPWHIALLKDYGITLAPKNHADAHKAFKAITLYQDYFNQKNKCFGSETHITRAFISLTELYANDERWAGGYLCFLYLQGLEKTKLKITPDIIKAYYFLQAAVEYYLANPDTVNVHFKEKLQQNIPLFRDIFFNELGITTNHRQNIPNLISNKINHLLSKTITENSTLLTTTKVKLGKFFLGLTRNPRNHTFQALQLLQIAEIITYLTRLHLTNPETSVEDKVAATIQQKITFYIEKIYKPFQKKNFLPSKREVQESNRLNTFAVTNKLSSLDIYENHNLTSFTQLLDLEAYNYYDETRPLTSFKIVTIVDGEIELPEITSKTLDKESYLKKRTKISNQINECLSKLDRTLLHLSQNAELCLTQANLIIDQNSNLPKDDLDEIEFINATHEFIHELRSFKDTSKKFIELINLLAGLGSIINNIDFFELINTQLFYELKKEEKPAPFCRIM